jgi:hypothetical protein
MIFAVLLTINSGAMANKKTDMSISDLAPAMDDQYIPAKGGQGH